MTNNAQEWYHSVCELAVDSEDKFVVELVAAGPAAVGMSDNHSKDVKLRGQGYSSSLQVQHRLSSSAGERFYLQAPPLFWVGYKHKCAFWKSHIHCCVNYL